MKTTLGIFQERGKFSRLRSVLILFVWIKGIYEGLMVVQLTVNKRDVHPGQEPRTHRGVIGSGWKMLGTVAEPPLSPLMN